MEVSIFRYCEYFCTMGGPHCGELLSLNCTKCLKWQGERCLSTLNFTDKFSICNRNNLPGSTNCSWLTALSLQQGMDKLMLLFCAIKTVQKMLLKWNCSHRVRKRLQFCLYLSLSLSGLIFFFWSLHSLLCICITRTYTLTHSLRLQKALREFNKQVDSLSSSGHLGGAWDSAQLNQIDRSLGEMRRTLTGNGSGSSDQLCFSQLGGLASVLKMLLLCSEPASNCGNGQQTRAKPLLPDK
jgi:hypothetical protein